MFKQFWVGISKLRDASQVSSFLSDFLTDTEEVMLAKRFTVAVLLLKGKRPVDIVGALHVTYTTVGSVASWVKNAKPHTRAILERIIHEQSWQALLDRVEEVLDKLPPAYHTSWSRVGKEKWNRKMDRASRGALR